MHRLQLNSGGNAVFQKVILWVLKNSIPVLPSPPNISFQYFPQNQQIGKNPQPSGKFHSLATFFLKKTCKNYSINRHIACNF
jgi:hypothetical protein